MYETVMCLVTPEHPPKTNIKHADSSISHRCYQPYDHDRKQTFVFVEHKPLTLTLNLVSFTLVNTK